MILENDYCTLSKTDKLVGKHSSFLFVASVPIKASTDYFWRDREREELEGLGGVVTNSPISPPIIVERHKFQERP